MFDLLPQMNQGKVQNSGHRTSIESSPLFPKYFKKSSMLFIIFRNFSYYLMPFV